LKIVAIALVILTGGAFFAFMRHNANYENFLLLIRNVPELEKETGDPAYVFNESVHWFGNGLIEKDDYDEGYTLKVYSIRKIRPRFLVVKVHPNGWTITGSRIETS
jgi:hypothetical protein